MPPKGKIKFQGPGTFIAAGTGINPFLSIFRTHKSKLGDSQLFYANKFKDNTIAEKELKEIFKDRIYLTLTQEKRKDYLYGRIDENFIKKYIKNFNQKFYICGPFDWVKETKKILINLGAKEEDIFSDVG